MWAPVCRSWEWGVVLPPGRSPILQPRPALLLLGSWGQLPTGEESLPRTLTVAGPAPRPPDLLSVSLLRVSPSPLGPKLLLHRCQNLQLTDLAGQKKQTGRVGRHTSVQGGAGACRRLLGGLPPACGAPPGLCGPRNTAGPFEARSPGLLWTHFTCTGPQHFGMF